jgi:hypothetical protein
MNTIGYVSESIEGKEAYGEAECRRRYWYLSSFLNSASSRRGKKEIEIRDSIDELDREDNRGLKGLLGAIQRFREVDLSSFIDGGKDNVA